MVNIDEKMWEEFKVQNCIGETKSFPGSSAGKESAWDSGDPGSISWWSESLRRDGIPTPVFLVCPGGIRLQWEHLASIPGLERSSEVEHGNPPQYSCLENPHGHRSLGGLQSMGVQRVGHDWAIKHSTAHEKQSILIKSIMLIMDCGWERGGKEVQEGGDISILTFDSHWCMAETSTTL